MKRCSVCGSKFGLTRHYYDLKSFSSLSVLPITRPLGAFERPPALPLLSPLKEIGNDALHLLRHALPCAVALPQRMAHRTHAKTFA